MDDVAMTPASWWPALLIGGMLAVGYVMALHARPRCLPPWRRVRTGAWLVGTLLVTAAVSPPLAAHVAHDHRLHMAQHLLLGMYAPLGLVLGAPGTLLLGSLPRRWGRVAARFLRTEPVHVLCHPVTATVLNVGGMFVLYLTPLYRLSLSHPLVHGVVLTHFLLAGCLFTWTIGGPDPAPRRPGVATRTATLVIAGGLHAFVAKMLYARADQLSTGLADGDLMRGAAQGMYYGGDGAEIVLAVMLFAWWYHRGAASVTAPAAHPGPRLR